MNFINIKTEMNYIQKRQIIKNRLKNLVESKGFLHVEPDIFEDYHRFIEMNQRIPKESLVTLLGDQGSPMILRPDITSSIISYVVPRLDQDTELKLYYDSSYFRRGENMEIIEKRQWGIEQLGLNHLSQDNEMIELALDILKGFSHEFVLVINHNGFLTSLLDELSIPLQIKQGILEIINKKNRSALSKLITRYILDKDKSKLLNELFDFNGNWVELNRKLSAFTLSNRQKEVIKSLEDISKKFKETYENVKIIFDLSLISDYDYYQGILFKGFMYQQPKPILDGGRYDVLTESYGKKVPAIGFSIDILELMKEGYDEK